MDISQFLNFKDRKQLIIDVFLWLVSASLVFGVLALLNVFSFWIPINIYIPETILVALLFLVIILFFRLLKDSKRWIEIISNKDKVFSYEIGDWPGLWSFNGGSEFKPEELKINSSRAGCLLENHYWKNFSMSFEVKLHEENKQDQKLFGVIFRAKDLDNYFMLEIGFYDGINRIKPHVRYRGGWEELAVKEVDEFKFDSKSGYRKFKLSVVGNEVNLYYKGKIVFTWGLPTHVDVNHYESGAREDKAKEKSDSFLYQGHVQEISFRNSYGLVGFRSHWHHAPAIIKSLKVEPEKLV